MRIDISYKYIEETEFLKNVLDNNFRKLERRLKIYKRDDPIHVSIHIEKNPHKEQFFCRSHIYLPTSKVLVADEKGRNASVAINKAFAALNRQLGKEKHKWDKTLRKERRRAKAPIPEYE
jgi:ribosomal subunit interface protein